MEKKINVAELLKDCPKGMELDCLMYDNVYFKCIREHAAYPIVCYTIDSKGEKEEITFSWYGKYALTDTAKCVIFPKGKTTWEGFHRPFVDGDIIYTKHKLGSEFVSIFQIEYERDICTYWDLNLTTNKIIGSLHDGNAFKVFIEKDKVKEQRLATEEEKEKLFKVIKDNGYNWNDETKTLENITVPHTPDKFDISTLKPFDRVLVRDTDKDMWIAALFSHLRGTRFYTVSTWYKRCIPFEGNQHLVGTTDDCDEYYKTWTNEEE